MKVLLYTLYLLLITCYFTPGLLYGAEPMETESVRAGFNGLYRPGYWCPVRMKVTTGSDEFKGKVILEVDNNTYTQIAEIPPRSQREIIWNVLIYSLNPHSQIISRTDEGREKSISITLQPISTQEFLIAIEKESSLAFQRKFEQYSDAARRTHYFTFSPEDLPNEWQFLEAVDLLVISEDSLQKPQLEPLKQWAKSGLGNILALKGPPRDLEGLGFLKITRSENPALRPEIYYLFERTRWPGQIKDNATRFFFIYLLVTVAIIILAFWIMHNKWPGLILWLVIIGGVSGSFGLLFGFCPITQLWDAESVHIVTLNQSGNTLIQKDFVNLTSLSNKPLSISFEPGDRFVKPLFITSGSISRKPLHYLINRYIILQGLALGKRNSIVFERETIQEVAGRFEIIFIQRQPEHPSKCRVINETNFNLKDCFLLYKEWCIWIGRLPTERTTEVLLDKTHFTAPPQFLNLRFNQTDKKSRYQRRVLEMYLKKHEGDKQFMLFGWAEQPPGDYKIIPDEEAYPTLWVIPVIP